MSRPPLFFSKPPFLWLNELLTFGIPAAESLDDALIRPGRVDLQVAFSNATGEQVTQLFERMYEPDNRSKPPPDMANGIAGSGHDHGHNKEAQDDTTSTTAEELSNDQRLHISAAELHTIAADLASRIPDGTFSPAEIQGFLLRRKKSPRAALAEVDSWVEHTLQQRASKTKVLLVQ